MTAHEAVLSWQGANLSFCSIAAMVLISAAFAAFSTSITRAAYSLFFTLLGMAGFYVLLGSGFLAITQVIIYVGGILVLLMFGVLLTDRPTGRSSSNAFVRYLVGTLVCALLMTNVLMRIIFDTPWKIAPSLDEPREHLTELGRALIGDYLLPLEIAGMALLLCLVGAAYLVRRKEP